ncbi:MAG TPA: hypothetical protein VGM20_07385 [Gemmatimonadales bacterium]
MSAIDFGTGPVGGFIDPAGGVMMSIRRGSKWIGSYVKRRLRIAAGVAKDARGAVNGPTGGRDPVSAGNAEVRGATG